MAVRAKSNMTFYIRYLVLGLAGLGFGLWHAYDGIWGFPNQRERALKYQEFSKEAEQAAADGTGSGDFADRWVDYAQSQGWPVENPGEPQTQVNIYYNYFVAIVCIPLGAYLLFCVNRARGRWIEGDGQTIRASWGPEVPLGQVTGLNKRQWQKKGIAKVLYNDNGRTKRFVLDDFKFKREPTGQILRQVEARLTEEQITGGPPEPPQQA